MIERTTQEGWIDLAVGEPVFLQKALAEFYPWDNLRASRGYPTAQGDLALRQEIAYYLDSENLSGGEVDPECVVVTNGAMQALAAVMAAARDLGLDGDGRAWARWPHFPYFPQIAEQAKMKWVPQEKAANYSVEIYTWPNNPTGCDIGVYQPERTKHGLRIWDAVYASHTYGYTERPEYDVGVGSASKAFGLTGLRVGWAWFKNRDLARAAARYVEYSSAGVSAPAQHYLSRVLHIAVADDDYLTELQNAARATLLEARKTFSTTLGPYVELTDGLSMFAFFKPHKPWAFQLAADAAKVSVVPFEGDYWRINLGADAGALSTGLDRLAKALA